MEELTRVRKRIKKRRYGEHEPQPSKHWIFKSFYRLIMVLMGVCMVVLALLVNQKLNIIEMPAVLQDFKLSEISRWLPFENWFSLKDETVSATQSYALLKGNQYSNGSNVAYNAYDAMILHVQKNKDGTSNLSVKQDNGVITTYGNLHDVSLKQDERILKGRPLGTYTSYVTIDFLKDNKAVSLDVALLDSQN